MRFAAYRLGTIEGLAAVRADGVHMGISETDAGYPGDLGSLVAKGQSALAAAHALLLQGKAINLAEAVLLPPIARPGKIICVGLNYRDHSEIGRAHV